MNAGELKKVLDSHKAWLGRDPDGKRANLRGANLSEANLSEADLRGADLSGATGNFVTFSVGRHEAVFAGGYGCIGCERHEYQVWLDNGHEIGENNNYSGEEITRYMAMIKIAVEWLRSVEK